MTISCSNNFCWDKMCHYNWFPMYFSQKNSSGHTYISWLRTSFWHECQNPAPFFTGTMRWYPVEGYDWIASVRPTPRAHISRTDIACVAVAWSAQGASAYDICKFSTPCYFWHTLAFSCLYLFCFLDPPLPISECPIASNGPMQLEFVELNGFLNWH